MRTSFATLVLALALGVSTNAAAQVLPREVRERLLEGVVEVLPFDARTNDLVGTGGSGNVISPSGMVLTN